MKWLENILILLARYARKMALMRKRKFSKGASAPNVGQQAFDVYVAALKRLALYVVLLAVVWLLALLVGKPLSVGATTILLVVSTMLLVAAAWPAAFVLFEHERYQKIAVSIIVTELGVGLIGMFVHIPIKDVVALQVAGLYLVFSSYLGKAKGVRLWGNRLATGVMAIIFAISLWPSFGIALRPAPAAVGNVAAAVATKAVAATNDLACRINGISDIRVTSNTATVAMPDSGCQSSVFNTQNHVPKGWWYQIDEPPAGTIVHWQDGSAGDYQEISKHSGQSFSFSRKGGGTVIIEWRPVSSNSGR
ncbi:MAG: hypothetical protein M1153_00305 [Patescibacteria group bacterium]|nr:hypothetical protein [Patescibacteria group bacterium]